MGLLDKASKISNPRNKLDETFLTDLVFQERFIETAIEFIERNQTTLQICEKNYRNAIECSLEYLKEESAIIMPLWAELQTLLLFIPRKY